MRALSGLNALLWVGAGGLALWIILHFVWIWQNISSHRKNWRTTDLMTCMCIDDLTVRVSKIEMELKVKGRDMTREQMITAFKDEALKDMMIDYSAMTEDDKAHVAEDIESAYRKSIRDADANFAWRLCADEMPADPHQSYWVYTKCCGECCVAYLQEKTNIFYDEGGEELSGVVAWLPLPEYKSEKK